jgi:polyhydroxyalkanoate synthesis regulator protein
VFHLIKKYSNRKLYDTCDKRFITLDDLLEMILKKEEIRIEDSDTRVDITSLEVTKALMRYINNANSMPDSVAEILQGLCAQEEKKSAGSILKSLLNKFQETPSKLKAGNNRDIDSLINSNDEILSYVPAEIRLLNKSVEYLQGAMAILKSETPFNGRLHDELYVLYKEFDRKLSIIKKKYRIS